MLGVGASNAVECAEFPHPVRGADRTHTLDAGVAVSSIRCVELVAATNPTHAPTLANRIADGKGKVTRHSEDILHGSTKKEHSVLHKPRNSGIIALVEYIGNDEQPDTHAANCTDARPPL